MLLPGNKITVSEEAQTSIKESTSDLNTVVSGVTNDSVDGKTAVYKTEEELKATFPDVSLYTKICDIDFEVNSIELGGVTYNSDTQASLSLNNNVFLKDVMFKVSEGALYVQTAALSLNATTNPEITLNDGAYTIDVSSLASKTIDENVKFKGDACFRGSIDTKITDLNEISITTSNNTKQLSFEVEGLDASKNYKAVVKTVLNDDERCIY